MTAAVVGSHQPGDQCVDHVVLFGEDQSGAASDRLSHHRTQGVPAAAPVVH